MPARDLLGNVTAIVLKKSRVVLSKRQVVYEIRAALAIWDRDHRKRIHWIPRRRVFQIER